MTIENDVLIEQEGEVAAITLNRPDKHNAFDDKLIAYLTSTLRDMAHDASIGAVLLQAEGPSFSAGADANWMQRMAEFTETENVKDADALAGLMATLDDMPKPTIARVQGPAIGGGVGLVACCDIAIAAEDAFVQLSEVRLGLTPATISPFVIRAIGGRAARRYFLTAERIDAETAKQIGLFHEVVPGDELDDAVAKVLNHLSKGGRQAKRLSKKLIADVRDFEPAAMRSTTVQQIAKARTSPEGQEGLSAFLEKRKPDWVKDD
ncbi:MAG: enoyl-CoA hydratase/isomerase family protein [Alphaproteobacteria bacterium]|nr:enoyl-CoA hydratase/isomerase family protein [Alphaproteobacteria bacterium SS10]